MNEQEHQKQEMKLSDLLNSPTTSILELVSTVEKDKELAELVLAKANTATYGLRRRVISLREAVVLIGFRNLRDLAEKRNPTPRTPEQEMEI